MGEGLQGQGKRLQVYASVQYMMSPGRQLWNLRSFASAEDTNRTKQPGTGAWHCSRPYLPCC